MHLKKPLLTLTVISALLIAGCSGGNAQQQDSQGPAESSAAGFPLTIDNCGHQLTFQKAPERTV